ncbi:hypothetical protein L6452_44181 [Arctium lappa]|uniref:Uncharacterized protein n=1 Tax=Arctium lappa TaxID=4217 RepID=A0ACB8XFD2_ARCLA|nr:hypothetical protein L6452_44181 [Arctium lappa]
MPLLHRTKHAFPIPIFNLFHSKNSLFHLFIFLICLSIGFVAAFYLRDFSSTIQTSSFSVFTSLLSSTPPLLTITPPPQNILSLQPISSQPPQPLSLSPPPPLDQDTLSLQPLSLSPPPPPPDQDTLSLQPLSLSSPPPPPDQDTLSLQPISSQPPQPLSPPPLPLPPPPQDNTLSLQPTSSPPSQPPLQPPPIESLMDVSLKEQIPMMHNGSDEDLVSRVMKISITNTTIAPYKVAFMFMTPGPMPLSPLWELFFKGHKGLFTIYIHPHPDYNDTFPQDSVFYGTRIASQPVHWGDISMVDAERRLLANALLDPLNQRFVLLSESCIPLFNFTTTYSYLVNSNLSYISSFDDKRKSGRGRYNPQMSPNITIQDWRKGSQWFEINRDLALRIVIEHKYYSIFKEFCHPPCYNDEHYLPTMVNILYGEMNSNRSITHVDWSIVGPHPRKFVQSEITEELLNSIRFAPTECVYNNNTTPMCLLFARKFTPGTLKPLLTFAPLLFGFNP